MTTAEAAKNEQLQEPSPESEGSLFTTWRQIASDFLDLVSLEFKLAGVSLAVMVALGMGAALLLITAWLLLVAAIACWIMIPDTAWPGTLGIIALVNIIAAVTLGVLMRKRSGDLAFIRTRRQFAPKRTAAAATPET